MAAPILLVHDDIATIATVRRLLAREGYEIILASSAADAIIAFGHYLPGLIILASSVEGGRGHVVLEELAQHPDSKLVRVLILGESIPGFGVPVAPLPLDGASFLELVRDAFRTAPEAEGWQVEEAEIRSDVTPLPPGDAPEDWRAAAPPEVTPEAAAAAAGDDAPFLQDEEWGFVGDGEPAAEDRAARAEAAAQAAMEATHAEVEAEAVANLESSLPTSQLDSDLEALEDEVRAEAAARRKAREARQEADDAARARIAAAPAVVDRPAETSWFDDVLSNEIEPEPWTPSPGKAEKTPEDVAGEAAQAHFEEQVRREAEAAAEREIAESRRRDLEERARQDIEEQTRLAAEEVAREAAKEEKKRKAAAKEAEREAEEARQKAAAEEAEREAEEARQKVAAEEAEHEAADEARQEIAAEAEHEAEEAQRKAAEAEAERAAEEKRAADAEAEAEAQRLAEEAEQQAAAEAAERAAEEAKQKAAELAASRAAKEAQRKAAEQARLEADAQREKEAAERAEVERQAQAEIERLESERESARADAAEKAREAAEQEAAAQRASERAEALAVRERAALSAAAKAKEVAEAARREADAVAARLREEADEALEASRSDLKRVENEAADERKRRATLEAELEELRRSSDSARQEAERGAQLALELEELRRFADAAREEAELAQATAQEAARRAEEEHRSREEAERARETAEKARLDSERAREQAEDARRQSERAREEAEQSAVRSREEAKAAASSAVVPLVVGRDSLKVPLSGAVGTKELAQLVVSLCRARVETRLELKAGPVLRVLWLQRGALVGATSSSPQESLVHRARRDGLIGKEQEAELRLMRAAPAAETLEALRSRGYVRDGEVVPLVQRYAEQIALEALSETETVYRLAAEPIASDAVAASPRPLLQILMEALRRSLDPEQVLTGMGGTRARPQSLDSPLDAKSLGLTEKEQRLLRAADGERTVEELLLAVGVRQEAGLKLLGAAELLGLTRTEPPEVLAASPSTELDVERLSAKFDQIQEGDYFSILGLPRSAGGDEVERAFTSLTAEFHPLKFAGHPDPALQHRARQIHEALSEAAHVLQDDRLRAAYARHLVD